MNLAEAEQERFLKGVLALHAKASPNLLDLERQQVVFAGILTASLTRVFIAPRGVILILQGIVPTQGAFLSILNARPIVYKHRGELLKFLGETMDSLQLPRVTFMTASPATAKLALFFSMVPEGCLRSGGLMDGKLEDVEIFGMLRREMPNENLRENPVEQAQAVAPEPSTDSRADALVARAFGKS